MGAEKSEGPAVGHNGSQPAQGRVILRLLGSSANLPQRLWSLLGPCVTHTLMCCDAEIKRF